MDRVKDVKNNLLLLKKSFKLIYENMPWLMPVSILSALASALYPFINIYMSALIVDKLSKPNLQQLIRLVIITIAANFIGGIIVAALKNLRGMQEKMFYIKQKQITSNKIMSLDYESLEAASTHDKMCKVNDMHELTGCRLSNLAAAIPNLIEQITMIIASITLVKGLFMLHSKNMSTDFQRTMNSPLVSLAFALFIVVIITINMFLSLKHGKIYFKLWADFLPFNKLIWYFDSQYLDTHKTGKEIRIFRQDKLINKSYDSAMKESEKLSNKIGNVQGIFGGISAITSLFSSSAIYLFVSLKALTGIFGVGSLVKYVGAINQFCKGLNGIVQYSVTIKETTRFLKVYWDFMDIENVNYKGTIPVEKRTDNEYEIEFKNVSFKYPGVETYALKNVSLKLHIGERLAVVGRNGSGKTTFIKLLCRLYDPIEGEILLNGINIKKYNINEYRRIFSVVFQDFKLFSFTIGQNVAAQRKYNHKEVKNFVESAGLGERLDALENGLDTYIYNNFSEKGVEISGGEAQKIALARALYKNAPFIVLDEPTAALDPIAEFEIYSKFNDIVGNKTAVYISHRLSSCRFCDDIVVFDKGQIIQRGSHDSLIKNEDGKYFRLWHAQAQYYDFEN